MFGSRKPQPVAEHEARGELERVYYEIPHVLRVRGVNLNFRTWAGYGDFLPVMWDAIRPTAETRAFEEAADQLRAEAADAASTLGRLDALDGARLGESQRWHIERSLDLYHYINPKLLLITSAVRLALLDEPLGTATPESRPLERIERGPPAEMLPMEMTSDEPDDKQLRSTFDDIKQTLDLPSVNSDYRTLGLWPEYLESAWQRLKPLATGQEHRQSSDRLRESARRLARTLPWSVPLSSQKVRDIGEDPDKVLETTVQFERLLPGLIINIGLMQLDFHSPEELRQSPYPAGPRLPEGSS